MTLFLAAWLMLFSHQATADTAVTPATVAVVFDKNSVTPVVVEGYGNRATARRVEANDPVRIASISKLLIAITALRLVDDDRKNQFIVFVPVKCSLDLICIALG